MITVKRDAKREFFLGDDLEGVIEIIDGPIPSCDRAGHRPAGVLIVGHEADKVDGFGDGADVVGATPVCVDPLGKATGARIAGSVGDGGDGELQADLVESFCGNLNEFCELVAMVQSMFSKSNWKPV